jgi:HD superfamily phosphohydrolase YqeK
MTDIAKHTERLVRFARSHRNGSSGDATGQDELRRNLDLKERHSLRVLAEAETIVAAHLSDARLASLAKLAALYHDIGRFPQFLRFRTFRDDNSLNHGWLGSRTLREQGFLSGLDRVDQLVVLGAVHLHNRRELPTRIGPELRLVTNVVRDADKLDIQRIFLGHFTNGQPGAAAKHNLDDTPDRFSPEVLEAALDGSSPDYRKLKYVNDFKLLFLHWGFALNFAASRKTMLERGIVDAFQAELPEDEGIGRFCDTVRTHLAA